jgi:hypothetical protein
VFKPDFHLISQTDLFYRTFSLFDRLNLSDKKIPYYLEDVDKVCPSYYNDVRHVGPVDAKANPDPYRINVELKKEDEIPAW